MRMVDLIQKKRDGGVLSGEELRWMVRGYAAGEIPDYQMSAMLMAIYFQGMEPEETAKLTLEMAESGETADLSGIKGVKADKHSTGGVGDKTTLIVAPVVAACGIRVAKMSGRGLGHTGGTLDKLESIPGFQISIDRQRFFDIVNDCGLSVIGQTGNLVPADKKLYALRDVTGTVNSIPLIASSIMSKKLAAGSDCIVLDVKTGSGAFMKTLEDSRRLAEEMVSIGKHAGRKVAAVITDMDVPLGAAVGNALEVAEAVRTLKGKGPKDLEEVSLVLAARMLSLAGKGDFEASRKMAEQALKDGSAFACLKKMVQAQGGDSAYLEEPERFPAASCSAVLEAPEEGFVSHMDTEGCGTAAMLLGAGRATKEDSIDYSAGILLYRKYGDFVHKGEPLAALYAGDEKKLAEGKERLARSYRLGKTSPAARPLIYDTIL